MQHTATLGVATKRNTGCCNTIQNCLLSAARGRSNSAPMSFRIQVAKLQQVQVRRKRSCDGFCQVCCSVLQCILEHTASMGGIKWKLGRAWILCRAMSLQYRDTATHIDTVQPMRGWVVLRCRTRCLLQCFPCVLQCVVVTYLSAVLSVCVSFTLCICLCVFVRVCLSVSTLGETQLVRPHEKLPGITWVSNPATRKDLAARTWGVSWY